MYFFFFLIFDVPYFFSSWMEGTRVGFIKWRLYDGKLFQIKVKVSSQYYTSNNFF